MLNPIKEICKWQIDAGNASRPYDDFLESSFQIEEALEGFNTENLYKALLEVPSRAPNEVPSENTPKELSRAIVNSADWSTSSVSDVDRLDKACDAIIFAIGAMQKLGLDHHNITKALNIVNDANKAKLGMPRDEKGKLLKPDNFVGPEVKLQELLDSIK